MLFHVRNTKDDSKGIASISRPKGMVRYQRQRQDEECHRLPSRRTGNDKELKNESRRAATRSTLICIFVCGSLLLSLGIVVLVAGLLASPMNHDKTPWLVIGPTCIVLGILVLLLSVEIIIKLRKIAAASGVDDSDSPVPVKKVKKHSWDSDDNSDNIEELKHVIAKAVPAVVPPPKHSVPKAVHVAVPSSPSHPAQSV